MNGLLICALASLIIKSSAFDFPIHQVNNSFDGQIQLLRNVQTDSDENGTAPLVPFNVESLSCSHPAKTLKVGESIAFSTGQRTPGNGQNCRFEFDIEPAFGSQMVIVCSQLRIPCIFNDNLGILEGDFLTGGCFQATEAFSNVFFTYEKVSSDKRLSFIYRAHRNSPVITGMTCTMTNQGPRGTGSTTTKRPPKIQTCGVPPSASSRIINGTVVTDNEFGFMAKLIIDNQYLCGASVLNSRWLLTAAHCLTPSSNVAVLFDCIGSVNCRQSQTQDQIYLHPNWDEFNVGKGFDIALIRLSQDIQFSDAVWPVCLPTSPPNIGANMTVIGFGKIATDGPTSQDLIMGTVKVEPMSTCRRTFGNGLGASIFCANQNPSATYRGDSGSFGGMRRNGRLEVDGIISFGGPICEEFPMGFTMVNAVKEWIESHINDTV